MKNKGQGAPTVPCTCGGETLTQEELAKKIKARPEEITQMRRKRGSRPPIPAMKFGNKLRFHWCEVFAWAQKNGREDNSAKSGDRMLRRSNGYGQRIAAGDVDTMILAKITRAILSAR